MDTILRPEVSTEAREEARFRNILITTDFSPASLQAVPAAAALARKFDSQVYVAHVFLPPLYPNVPASAAAVLLAEERQNAEWQMKNFLRDEAFRELAPQALFATGAPVESLLDLIDKNHIDLVVIATHGRSGLRRMVLGSVAEALMRHSPCPILMVPRTAQQG